MRTTLRLVFSVVFVSLGLATLGRAQSGGWTLPEDARTEKSPLRPSADLLEKGRALFISHCQKCHGPQGKGDGPDGNPDEPPADLTDPSRAAINPEGVVFYKVWNGRTRPKMPAFKSELTNDEVWTIVEYVKTLRQ